MAARAELRNIHKRFLGVVAEDDVSLEIRQEEVLGLLGENGAGKSTLMKILYGLYQADSGSILWEGDEVHIGSPHDAIALGIGMVHQHFMLVDHHTVLENVIVGDSSVSRRGVIDYGTARSRFRSLSERYGLSVEPDRYVSDLSVGERQRVEILKALYRDVRLLILDEPTAVLTPQEVDSLFEVLRHLVADGMSVVFISHKLNEVLRITNRVVVLRRGKVVGERDTVSTTKEDLARLMVGDEEFFPIERNQTPKEKTLLKLSTVCVDSDEGSRAVRDVTLEVTSGEILGIAGVSGNGQRELSEAIAGVRPLAGGSVHLAGEDISGRSPATLVERGMARVPEDRMGLGLVLEFSISENLALERIDSEEVSRGPFIRWKNVERLARDTIERFDIRCEGPQTMTRQLSGGNIQKTLLGREMSIDPQFILASQPTRGLDLHAANYVHHLLLEKRAAGCGVLLISEDLDELLAVSDVIAVMYHGEIVGTLLPGETTRQEIGTYMLGLRRQTEAEPSHET